MPNLANIGLPRAPFVRPPIAILVDLTGPEPITRPLTPPNPVQLGLPREPLAPIPNAGPYRRLTRDQKLQVQTLYDASHRQT